MRIKEIVSIAIISTIGYTSYTLYMSEDVKEKDEHQTSIKKEPNIKQNKDKKEKVIYSNTEHLKKVNYSKVTLPKELSDIEHKFVDIQNYIQKDKYLLDQETQEILKNDDTEDMIKEADLMLSKINSELNIPEEEINKIEESYTLGLSTKLTSIKSKAIEKELVKMDERVLVIEKEFENLQRGDIKWKIYSNS